MCFHLAPSSPLQIQPNAPSLACESRTGRSSSPARVPCPASRVPCPVCCRYCLTQSVVDEEMPDADNAPALTADGKIRASSDCTSQLRTIRPQRPNGARAGAEAAIVPPSPRPEYLPLHGKLATSPPRPRKSFITGHPAQIFLPFGCNRESFRNTPLPGHLEHRLRRPFWSARPRECKD